MLGGGRAGGGGGGCWVGVGWVVEGEGAGGLMIYYRSHDTGAKHLLSHESAQISFSLL